MILQPFASRPHSLREQASRNSWQFGIDTFFTQEVPFSSRNSPVFAKQLVGLFADVAKTIPDETLHVYELGAGLGLLGRYFLETLESDYPDLYAKTCLHLTESSAETLQHWAQDQRLTRHDTHIRLENVDFLTFSPDHPIAFCYSVYVLDALPTRHIGVNIGQICEILVKTELKEGATVLDTTQDPPTPLSPQALHDLLQNPSDFRARALAPQWVPALSETFGLMAMDDLPYWTEEDKIWVRQFVENSGLKGPISFNFIPALADHFKHIEAALHPNGLYCVADFGRTELGNLDMAQLFTPFGTTLFYGLNYPLLNFLTQQLGFSTWLTERDSGKTQDWVIFKNPAHKNLIETHLHPSDDPCLDALQTALPTLLKVEATAPIFKALLATLSEADQKNHTFLTALSLKYFMAGDYEATLPLLETLKTEFGTLGIWGVLVEGWIFEKRGDLTAAIACYEQVLNTCPTFYTAAFVLADAYHQQKAPDKAEKAFKQGLLHAPPDELKRQLKR
ncbi:MAG: SAM-dependent methyltransferase [Candidatus Margulisiibacteriota bacterium]